MKITLDPHSGFCFGVVYAIQMAEDELDRSGSLYCLGDIVHNNVEVERLKAKGLKIIDHETLRQLHDCKVLIRAHGEPPETYQIALQNNIELIDASCPVVLKLQNRVRSSYEEVVANNGQVVIYGEIGHAEVNGLVGQTGGEALIIRNEDDLSKIDFSRPIYFFSQTTKSSRGFERMKALIEERSRLAQESEIQDEYLSTNDTICRQVSNREPQLRKFAEQHDLILFVSGKKSSNGKALFEVCRAVNPRTYFISDVEEIDYAWFDGVQSIGICGATSTPMWLMQKVASHLEPIGTSA
ncbi:MAG: 4-hydroxy-3-methylbut-2-enyl diphosphate reductase [Bacteroidota bacterium]|jgi:4-hydroxy-3-methylbut-2-enyl diphosphate reductase|uniref:4-hydroxy-3-methylbut-2-enyl diphosphate reductase n=1 Tax=Candidatus Pollutiaquabacter sp. TaxID=3416354 RepID=UPI001A55E812|nr:4-hydroxy-3-methylbut-2-enyl diphosphate reductase [Bacteroidota bacterium]MBL7949921.1 4-hydroxy-3-methylbut-2-enyl diphosphate reductase [Bacteroidia bacterium]HRS38196.1 4-hydroxy-3-methylbut-2-enyl diphosphate reductase [Bacteroidia bacterium]HRU60404.1 4-hydroxy-3-methylbut-2-enyl diphosphate reductase [Bacteroidia bacterium]